MLQFMPCLIDLTSQILKVYGVEMLRLVCVAVIKAFRPL